MTDYLALLASIDAITADTLTINIGDDDLSNYFSSYVYSEIIFPWNRDSEVFAQLYNTVLPLVIFKSPLDEMVEKNPYMAHATVINRLNDHILKTIPIPEDSKKVYSAEIYDTILSYMEYVLLPKWSYLSKDMRATYVFLLYSALNAVKEKNIRKEAFVTEYLLELDNSNILYPPSEYGLSELTFPRLATIIENYLTPPPLSLIRERMGRRLLSYT